MINNIVSQTGFLSLLLFYVVGAFGSLLFRKSDKGANIWQNILASLGSLWGIFFSLGILLAGPDVSFSASSLIFPFLSFSFYIDKLSAFFIFIISLISLFCSIYGLGYLKHYYKKYSIGMLGFFYHLFIAGMLLVVSASNGLFFLIAWEIMSLASYFLVVYDRNDENNVKAGFIYLVMTHIGTAFIILAFLLLYRFTGSLDFEFIKASAGLIPSIVKNVIFILALVGFGTKAGIIPFHIWLPAAHPAAPSHVSALMSGVMIKTGIYMMIRVLFDLLQPIPLWWGVTVLIIGIVSALLGVLYALTEHDIKKLLAYHSIENIGIILLGLGSALIFSALGNQMLAIFALAASLFHVLNHATFKSLLFLSAGSVINQTHTRNMEEYGGLIKYMPLTALFFLIGSMAISALPPFNGFFSEWLTFQALLQGIMSADILLKSIFVLAIGSLAITGGLALACFVKAFGAIFLARPRSFEVTHAKDSSFTLSLGMGIAAVTCLLFGVFSGYVGSLILKISASLNVFREVSLINILTSNGNLNAPNGIGSISAPALFIFFVLAIAIIIFVVKFMINRQQKIKVGATWDCGVDLMPRMEITATGFARSILLIFGGILRPSIQSEIEYHDSESRYLPKSRTVSMGVRDIYQIYFYQPITKLVTFLSLRIKTIQSGNINTYVFYILIAMILALFLSQ
jgi:hydrogenase-4 component B